MQIGLLYPYDRKKHEEEAKKGKNVMVGVDVSSLLDDINELEIKHAYDLTKVLGELKYNCMVILGKIAPPKEEKEKEGVK